MTRFVAVVLFVCCACGCFPTTQRVYEICYEYDGASAGVTDGVARFEIVPQLRWEVVRTVVGNGKLSVFLRSSRTAKEIENDLNKISRLPEFMSSATIRELPKGLPPKPQIVSVPEVQIDFQSDQIYKLGMGLSDISEAMPEAIMALDTKDAEIIKNETFTTPNGDKIRFGDIATISNKMRPSHIVRDYKDGVALGK